MAFCKNWLRRPTGQPNFPQVFLASADRIILQKQTWLFGQSQRINMPRKIYFPYPPKIQ